jgi:chromosome segregation ATPase
MNSRLSSSVNNIELDEGEIVRVLSNRATDPIGHVRIVDFEGNEGKDLSFTRFSVTPLPLPQFGLTLLKKKLPAGFYENTEVTPTRGNGKLFTSRAYEDPDCEDERDKLKKEKEQLEARNNSLQVEIDSLKAEGPSEDCEAERKRLRAENQTLRDENAAQRKAQSNSDKAYEALNHTLEKEEAKTALLTQRITELEADLAECTKAGVDSTAEANEIAKALQQCRDERKKIIEDLGVGNTWTALENALAKEIKLAQDLLDCRAGKETTNTELAERKAAEEAALTELALKQTRIDELELLQESQVAGLCEAEVQAIRKEYEDAKAAALKERQDTEKKALDDCNNKKEAQREQYEASGEVKRIRDGILPMNVQFDAEYAGLQNEVASLEVQLADCEKDSEGGKEGEEVVVKGLVGRKRKREEAPASAGRKHPKSKNLT